MINRQRKNRIDIDRRSNFVENAIIRIIAREVEIRDLSRCSQLREPRNISVDNIIIIDLYSSACIQAFALYHIESIQQSRDHIPDV